MRNEGQVTKPWLSFFFNALPAAFVHIKKAQEILPGLLVLVLVIWYYNALISSTERPVASAICS